MGSKCLQIFIFLLLGILSYLAIQSLFYETIYHSDNLYLPLFVEDLKNGWGIHWYLPPSTYFFPDLFLMFALALFIPSLYLPVAYGISQLFVLLAAIYFFLRRQIGPRRAILVIHFLILSIVFSFAFFDFDPSGFNPFVFLYTSGHHSSSLILCLVLFLLLNRKMELSMFQMGFLMILILLAYSSDQFFILFLFSLFYLLWQRKDTFKIIFVIFLSILLSEWIRSLLSTLYHIPQNRLILIHELNKREIPDLFKIFLRYYYDFFKIHLTKISIYFDLLLLSAFLVLVYLKSPRKYLITLGLFGLLSFLFLGVIGRFAYPHPFPIRYLFPFLFLLLLYSLILMARRVKIYRPRVFVVWQCITLILLLSTLGIFLLDGERNTEKIRNRNQILVYLKNASNGNRFWTSYEAEKKIRFWSEGKLRPLPCDLKGRPYLWITGAFTDPLNAEVHCPSPSELYWFPNSLTKDF